MKPKRYKYRPLVSDSTRTSEGSEFFVRSVLAAADRKGLYCEVGTRCGGTAKLIIDQILDKGRRDAVVVCIDPYGDIPYYGADGKLQKADYTNVMRKHAQNDLFQYVLDKPIDLHLLIMEDTEYFKRFGDGYPVYNISKKIINKYAFVYLDGPHTTQAVKRQVLFFAPRISAGGVLVFDDVQNYRHDNVIDPLLLKNGFDLLEHTKTKRSYRLSGPPLGALI